jgi:hypothetical protein
MKKITTLTLPIFAILALTSLTTIIGCKGDDPKPLTKEEEMTALLIAGNGTWTPPATGGVTVDGQDVTEDLFEGFSIKFSDGTLTTTGTTPVWKRQDTWSFKDETATVMLRGQDNKEITFTRVSDTEIKLTLTWDQTTTEPGRTKSIEGVHVFTLTK